MSPASHHQLVVFGICIGVLLCAVLLGRMLFSRSRKQVQTEQDDLAERIEERLATGHFSREPSAIRPKAGSTSSASIKKPIVEEDEGEDTESISRLG